MTEQTLDLTIGQALDLGVARAIAGDHRSAIGLFSGVLKHEPNNFEALERIGSSLFEVHRYREALYYFWRGRKVDRRHPLALTNYGLCLAQLGHPEEALPDLERAASRAERDARVTAGVKALVFNNLGNTLERLGRHREALTALDRGIAYDPNDPFPRYNRGIVLLRLNRHIEAQSELELSLAKRPAPADSTSRLNAADAEYNLSMARLLLGDLKGGFALYDARLTTSENNVINLGLPADKKLADNDVAGKTILVHCEQGLGDDIQFFRFLPALCSDAKQVLIVTHRETRALLDGMPPNLVPLVSGQPLPDYDVWAALMSLPRLLGMDEERLLPPPWCPGIEPDRMAIECAAVLRPDRLNVGVVWAGNWLHKNNAHRSIDLGTFETLFEAKGCNFVSLQQMQAIDTQRFAEIKNERDNVSALYLTDLRDTAAVIERLDVVVTVDTGVAHLAGSLGKPVFILLPDYSTDWRWQRDLKHSPWYSSATLWRQPRSGDWKTPLGAVRTELEAWATIAAQKRLAT